MLIRDVVTQNDQAEFANDVQLSWYPHDERNLPLVRGYMFTGKAIEKKVSSVQVLKTIRDSFQWQMGDAPRNRLTVIATYGHGKSHLALSLANFFGKPADSPEFSAILNNVAHVAPDEAQGFRTYKENRPPHLVIRLRGDQPASLPQQFISALENAIEEHPNTQGTSLPFWFAEAKRVFSILSSDQRKRAEETLQEYNTDLASIIYRIEQRDATAYELCMKAATSALQVTPNFGGEVALEKVLEWAAKEFCSGDSPKAGGILILFDEFSLFIQRYSSRQIQGDAPLQDLLNGVENAKRKVVFVAFSQHDPNTVAREIYRSGGDKLDSLLKELERLPVAQHLNLYSSLETVLNAYLKQTPEFETLRTQYPNPFVRASSSTRSFMGRIYNETNGWDTELFDKTITYGCFPLHPLTTSLFSSVEFKQVINGRSMIGFVLETLKKRLDDDAILGNKPNWVHPIELVDWFQEMLNEERYREYRYASEAAFLGESPDPVQKAVLKGILLFIVGRLELGRIGANYEQAMAHLTGYKAEDCAIALETLKNGGYIRFDETKKVYVFWAANSGATKIQSLLEEELKSRTFGPTEHNSLNKEGGEWTLLQEISGVTWGSPEDWKAKERLVTRQFFTVENLKKWLPRSGFRKDDSNLVLSRGCIVRLIALSEEDIAFFGANASNYLKEALGDTQTPAPLLLTIPSEPMPQFCTNFLRYDQLSTWNNEKRKEVSLEAYTQRVNDLKKEIKDSVEKLRNSSDIVAPQAYANEIKAQGLDHNPSKAMSLLYSRAYIYAAKPYFTQYTIAATSHKKAVELLCKSLARNTVAGDRDVINTNKVAADLLTKFLKPNGSDGWGIVGYTDHVQAPSKQQIKLAWEAMDKAFVAGTQSVSVKRVLLQFLNPPFGYDPHQIALLFSAWCGLNRRSIGLLSTSSGEIDLLYYLDQAKSPVHLIELLCAIDPPMLERTDPDQVENELRGLIQRVANETLTTLEAKSLAKQLFNHAKNPDLDSTLTKQGQKVAETLQSEIDAATTYQAEENDIIYRLNDVTLLSLDKVFGIYDRIKKLPGTGRIREPQWKTSTSLRQLAVQQMAVFVGKECLRLEKFTSLADYGVNKTHLENLRRRLEPIGDLTLNNRVVQALGNLQQFRDEHDRKEKDRDCIAIINAMQPAAPLRILEENLAILDKMKPHSQATIDLIARKSESLQKSLTEGNNRLLVLDKRCEQVTNQAQAETLYNDLLRQVSQFADSSIETSYNAAVTKCKALVAYFTALKQIEETDVQSPNDENLLQKRISSLSDENVSHLTEAQRQTAVTALEKLATKASQKRQKALDWLADCEKKISQGNNLEEMENVLARVPIFFPQEENERLSQARHNLKSRIDKDVAEREAQRQDAPIAGQIQGLPTTGSLAQLREALTTLEALAPVLPKTKERKETRRTQIQQAIDQHLVTLTGLDKKVSTAIDLAQIKNIEQEIQRAYPKFEGCVESQQLDLLLERVQAKQSQQEEQARTREHDAIIIRSIKEMNTNGSLASLRSYQERILTLKSKLPETQQTITDKAEELSKAIEILVEKLAIWEKGIPEAVTSKQIREVETKGHGIQGRYTDTPEAQTLENSLNRCAMLRPLFEEKEKIEQTKPTTPEEYEQLTHRLQEIQSSLVPPISTVQEQSFQKTQAVLSTFVHQQMEKAENWLKLCERDLEAGADAHDLQKQLTNLPAFLPTSCRSTVDALQSSNQKRIDEDVIGQIVEKFKRIADREKRKHCLSRLQEVLAE